MTEALVRTGRRVGEDFPPPEELLAAREHRPFPLPSVPWVMTQSWLRLLFAHWPVRPDELRSLIPPGLELETFGGTAWVALTPFELRNLRVRCLPAMGGASEFLEMNLRTYVSRKGVPGVLFFSLDAGSAAGVKGARLLYRLPYHHADMSMRPAETGWRYHSRRRDGAAEARLQYRPTGEATRPLPGSFEAWAAERYCLYAPLRSGRLLRAHIHHPPWALAPAEAEVEVNTIGSAANVPVSGTAPVLHYAEAQHVLIWGPTLAE